MLHKERENREKKERNGKRAQRREKTVQDEGRRVTLQGKQEKGGEGEKGRGMIFTKKKEPLCDSFLDHHNDSKMSPLS